MKSLGCDVAMISCVGNDEDGKAIIETVKELGLETASIITSEDFPTGLVNVTLDKTGSATYEIKYPSAWDKIVLNDEARKLTNEADVLIYGSLVCRDEVSRESLQELLQTNAYKVFDVNLRKPHYTYEILERLMKSANFVKFNDEEILEIASALNFPHTNLKENINFISSLADVKGICVTRGKHGALLLWEGTFYENNGYPIVVADTVGAGDSFLATLVTSLLTDKTPQEALDLACAMGALVASSPGANPKISLSEIEDLMRGKGN
ncbi:carbohydrate kinase family protein [Flavobacterium panici]|nr:PfkB family carbohydrate kinase [Flavobacterium panici]